VHRAAQIIEAIVPIVQARVTELGVKVYAHRRLSLDPTQDELPAISIDYGEDRRLEGSSLQAFDSVLSIEASAIVIGTEEASIRTQLLDLREQIHIAIMADPRLGLPEVVIATVPGDVIAPIIDVEGELLAGELTTTWHVRYRMNLSDPG
jgi:hypothetical protein